MEPLESVGAAPEPVSVVAAASGQRFHLAIPRRGHVLTTVSEEHGRPVRAAVAVLADALQDKDCAEIHRACFSRRIREPGAWVVRSHPELLAWTLVSAWLTGFATGRITNDAGIDEAARWFFDGAPDVNPVGLVPGNAVAEADAALAECGNRLAYLELLPYVLDPHGPGSRLSVRRDAGTRSARDRKRAEGVYYTPADVADFMMGGCIEGLTETESPPAILDPACGTAVFLRAALAALKSKWPSLATRCLAEQYLLGTDIDPWALDAGAFVLLADCLNDGGDEDGSPLLLWHRLRLNFACVDALRLDPADRKMDAESDSEGGIVGSLASGLLPAPDEESAFDERVTLSRLFSGMPAGGLVVVGNPPYSGVGERGDLPALRRMFTSLGGQGRPGVGDLSAVRRADGASGRG